MGKKWVHGNVGGFWDRAWRRMFENNDIRVCGIIGFACDRNNLRVR